MAVCYLSLQSDNRGPTSITCTAPPAHQPDLPAQGPLFRTHESRRGLQDFVSPTQLSVLPPQTLQLRRLLTRRPRPRAGVHLSLPHPLPHRLARHTHLRRHRADRLPLRRAVLSLLKPAELPPLDGTTPGWGPGVLLG